MIQMRRDSTIESILEKAGRKERLSGREKRQLKSWSEKEYKPEDGTDFIKKKTVDYTVSVDVHIRKTFEEDEDPDENTVVCEAIQLIRKGGGDPDGDVVHEDTVRKSKVDMSGQPFDEDQWRENKLIKLYPKTKGEKERPGNELKLEQFVAVQLE